MGTRHFIGVVLKGEYRIAQYGQWDGNPEGQGKTVLAFLRRVKWDLFKEQLTKTRWITEEELNEIDATIKREKIENWSEVYPQYSRDCGADILSFVYESDDEVILVRDSRESIGNDWGCEFAYIIDLDNKRLEVYNGHNDKESRAKNRLKEQFGDNGLPLTKLYSLNAIPNLKQLCKDVHSEDHWD